MTRAEIRTLVKTLVSEGGTNYFTDAAYNRFIDDAYTEVHNKVPWDYRTATTSAVAATASYAFTGFSQIYRVDYDDRPLEFRTREWLGAHDARFDTVQGRPQFFYTRSDVEWGFQDDDTEVQTIQLYPIPDATLTIRVMGTAAALPIGLDASSPQLPDWCHRGIAYETAAMVLESQGELRAESLAQAYRMLGQWWVDNAMRVFMDRHSDQKNHVIGRSVHTPKRLKRETAIPGTGLTGIC